MFADRTSEFQNIYLSFKQQAAYNGGASPESVIPIPTPAALSAREYTARFNAFAQTVTTNLTTTHEMLENLALLVRGSGKGGDAFEDANDEIQQLTVVVKQRLSHLHRDIDQLSGLMEQTKKQLQQQGANKQCSQHTDVVVSSLRMRLMKTSKDFKEVLNSRTAVLSNTHERRSRYTYEREDDGASMSGSLGSSSSLNHGGGAEFALMHSSGVVNNNLQHYRSRANAVKEIEKTVHELSEMFQDFARLVMEQESLIRRIDDDVTDALQNVDDGQAQLIKYLNRISSNRGLILKVFAILFVFVLFFGFFVVR
eukprot:PhF_6_TR8526/c0_g1_i3/m.13360/K08490/STX5; syntaxin 5